MSSRPYQLNIEVDDRKVTSLQAAGNQLCLAIGVQSGPDPTHILYNTIASVIPKPPPSMQINWKEDFQIAATSDGSNSSNGEFLSQTTKPLPIKLGQTLKLIDFSNQVVNPDKNAPTDGFRFQNLVKASAVVYEYFDNAPTQIYSSDHGPLLPGNEDLRPKAMASVWWGGRDAKVGDKVDSPYPGSFPVDLGVHSSGVATVSYTNDGDWQNGGL